jgi:hypothetical protein
MANRRFIDFPIASSVGDNDIVLIWQDGLNKQTTKGTLIQGAPTSLEGLTDVDIAGLINGQILQYNSVTGKWENVDRTGLNLSELGDVSIVSPSNGQVLVYNSTTSKWENSSAGFVPYVGAVTTVDLGAQGLRAGYVRFNTSVVSVPNEQGLMYWDGDDETIAVILNGYIMKIGEDQFYPVKNQTGSSIAKGTAVRFAGTVGASGRLLIAPFIADGSVPSSFFMGVTAEAIADGADGKVLFFGRIRGINTNAFNEGDVLYASTTVAGGFQTAVPVAPNNIVQVAAVITKSINQGVIFIRPSFGSNINQDEGVKIVSPTTGQLLQLQANGLWENKTKAQVLGGSSSQFVKGDGSLDSTAYVPTSREVIAGAGLTGGGALTGNVTLAHADTSSQASVDNSNGNVIQDVTLDTYGHITALASTNLDNRYYTETEIDSTLTNYQLLSAKGQPNGYAGLDSNGKVPLAQINDALIGNVNFQGLWNAATNTPTLANPPASGTKGHYYIVSTAGTFASISFEVGDWIISDGTAWGKVDNTDAVSSVFGRTGNVTAANGDYTTAQVTESGNLYFTSARVLATALTGYTVGTNTALAATDTILGAFGKVQAQINAKQNALNGTGFVKIAGTTISYDNTNYLPLTGGTLTGTLNGTNAVFSNTVTANKGTFTDGNQGLDINAYTGGNGYGAIYASTLTPNNSNYALIAKSDNTILNAPTGGSVNVSIGNTPRVTIASTGAATFTSSVTITDGGYYIYDTRTNLANRNWVLVSNAQFFGDFAIRQSNAKDGNPFDEGTDRFYIGATGAVTFSSLAGTGTRMVVASSTGVLSTQAITVGTVTSVAALTIGTTGTNITSTVANGTTTPVITLNVPTASATNRGALSAADWTTFNGKQDNIVAGTTAEYYRGDKTFQTLNTAAVTESTNLYFTNARAIASTLTGYTSGAGTISATDSILSAIQKLNGNIGGLTTGVSSVFGRTGAVVAVNGDYYLGTTAIQAASANQGLTGITGITFVAQSTDSASITTTISSTSTFFDFNLSDDNLNDEWRWRFTPSGASVYNAMRLVPTTNTTSDLIVSGAISGSNLSGTNTGNVTLGTANGLSLSTQQLSLGLASAGVTGALSGTDWSTFNSKVSSQWITSGSNIYYNTGSVGIGTASPRSTADVNGILTVGDGNPPTFNLYRNVALGNNSGFGSINFGARYDSTNYGIGASIFTNSVGVWSSTNYGGNLIFATTPQNSTTLTERMRINSAGNVGIGTNSPNTKLQVEDGFVSTYHNINANGAGYGVQFFTNGGGSKNTIAAIEISQLGTARSGDMIFSTSNAGAPTERMRITSAGNVGIGTNSPSFNLDVLTTSINTFRTKNSLSTSANIINIHNNSNLGLNSIVYGSAYAAGSLLSLGANGVALYSNSTSNFGVFTSTNTSLLFGTASTERMRITSTGNVGIGTNIPDTLLHLSSTTDTSILRLERNSVTITSGQSYGQVQWEGQDASTGAAGVRGSIDVISEGNLGETKMVLRTSGANFNANLDRLTINSAGAATFSSSVTSLAAAGATFVSATTTGGSDMRISSGTTTGFVGTTSNHSLSFVTNNNVVATIGTDAAVNFGGSVLAVGITSAASVAFPHTTKSANYTLTASDYTVGFDCASNRTANLPDATTCAGRIYVIYQYNTNIGLRYVTIDGNGSQTINGLTTVNLQYQDDFSSVMIQSNGSNWVVIASALYAAPV